MEQRITDYKNALGQLEKFRAESSKETDKHNELGHKIYDKYNGLKRHLEGQENLERDLIDKKTEEAQKQISEKSKPYAEIKLQIERSLGLIEAFKDKNNTTFEVYIYSDKDEAGNYISDKRKIILNPIEVLRDDNFKKIAVYIVRNGKPKNKYSLVIVGKSIFGEGFGLKRLFCYGLAIHETGCSLLWNIRDRPTIEELKEWYSNNNNKLNPLNEYLTKHREIEAEYKEAIKLYELKEWKILYLENQKDYYEKETEEYKEVIKQLKELKNGN